MSTSPFLDAAIPLPAPPEDRYIWAKVTQVSPLRIRVDGDRVELGITPDTLASGLAEGQRVYCQIIARRLVILGASGGPQDATPAGAVLSFAGAAAPAGYLLCDGAAVSRTTYAALYEALGGGWSPYGQGDGTTTFNVPNLKGRMPVGRDAAQSEFSAVGQTGGAKTHALSASEMPSHNHSFSATTSSNSHSHGTGNSVYNNFMITDRAGIFSPRAAASSDGSASVPAYGGNGVQTVTSRGTTANDSHSHSVSGTTGSAGSGGAHNNLQPYVALNFIIKT